MQIDGVYVSCQRLDILTPGVTVMLFNFASDLFSRYSRGRYYRENKSPRKFNTSIIVKTIMGQARETRKLIDAN